MGVGASIYQASLISQQKAIIIKECHDCSASSCDISGVNFQLQIRILLFRLNSSSGGKSVFVHSLIKLNMRFNVTFTFNIDPDNSAILIFIMVSSSLRSDQALPCHRVDLVNNIWYAS